MYTIIERIKHEMYYYGVRTLSIVYWLFIAYGIFVMLDFLKILEFSK